MDIQIDLVGSEGVETGEIRGFSCPDFSTEKDVGFGDCPTVASCVLTYSTGVGGAIVTHAQERIESSSFFDGCYERYASTTALVRMAMEYDPALDNGRKIFASLDDPEVMEILDRWVDEIMVGLATLTTFSIPNALCWAAASWSSP